MTSYIRRPHFDSRRLPPSISGHVTGVQIPRARHADVDADMDHAKRNGTDPLHAGVHGTVPPADAMWVNGCSDWQNAIN